jgi:hypothetical protein
LFKEFSQLPHQNFSQSDHFLHSLPISESVPSKHRLGATLQIG